MYLAKTRFTFIFNNFACLSPKTFSDYGGLNVKGVAAGERFLSALQDVADPERKRKIIGSEFIEVFQEEAAKLGKVDFLSCNTSSRRRSPKTTTQAVWKG